MYCSEICQSVLRDVHELECSTLEEIDVIAKKSRADRNLLCLLTRILCVRAMKQSRNATDVSSCPPSTISSTYADVVDMIHATGQLNETWITAVQAGAELLIKSLPRECTLPVADVVGLAARVNENSYSLEANTVEPHGEVAAVGLFPVAGLINHSCQPNCIWSTDAVRGAMVVRTTTYIAPGDEITIPYIDVNQPREARRRQLKQSKHFDCRCERCEMPLVEPALDALVDGVCCRTYIDAAKLYATSTITSATAMMNKKNFKDALTVLGKFCDAQSVASSSQVVLHSSHWTVTTALRLLSDCSYKVGAFIACYEHRLAHVTRLCAILQPNALALGTAYFELADAVAIGLTHRVWPLEEELKKRAELRAHLTKCRDIRKIIYAINHPRLWSQECPIFMGVGTPESCDEVPCTPTNMDTLSQLPSPTLKSIQRQRYLESVALVDMDSIILSGIDVPNDSTMPDGVYRAQVAKCKDDNLRQLIRRVEMDYFTLKFAPPFEDAFVYVLHRRAIRRIRYTLLLGFVCVLAKSLYGAHVGEGHPVALGLGIGVALPTIVVAFGCTFVEAWTPWCEYYSSIAFFIVCLEMTAEKLILHKPGPILPLFLCFVPVFGITRLRFHVCWRMVAFTIGLHLAALLAAGQEDIPDIFFQGFSYLGGIVGGAVAHYRNRQIEASFNRYWYLIDGSPFQNVHKCTLHQNAARTIRYAVQSAFLHQLLLALQDWRYTLFLLLLHVVIEGLVSRYIYLAEANSHKTYWVAIGLRLSVVLAYFGAQGLMWRYGHRYSNYWERHGSKQQPREHHESMSKPVPLLEAASTLPSNYVWKMQLWSASIVCLHALSMGLILIHFDTSGINSGVAAPCYYLALLNAILFPHRSGFRVRFVFATVSTAVVCVVFGVICSVLVPYHFLEYCTYVGITLSLGMFISYEEESVRRSFFVRRAIRSHEFATWHAAISVIRPYIRRKMAAKRAAGRRRVLALPSAADELANSGVKIPTSNLLATASKYGMYFDAVQAVVAACVLAAYLN
ncbi:hypothetical protein DYB32_004172 [Aphanomyces invadans]|uniref:SET domain-containing protein n=1 Tax=Aphanomyces invadans TaxID=157072 RepID=A0A3R6VG73_9STRA|nr:hypothetical protein DYB32_004172 [Aphanomyces invadans]